MNILNIITGTPTWVWILFGYLLFTGIKASQQSIIPLWRLMIIPAVFTSWSLYSVIEKSNCSLQSIFIWLLSLYVGIFLGYKIFNSMKFHIDQQTKLIHLQGTWINLILSMSFFLMKYCLNVIYAIHPIMRSNHLLLDMDIRISGVIAGLFLARLLIIAVAYRSEIK